MPSPRLRYRLLVAVALPLAVAALVGGVALGTVAALVVVVGAVAGGAAALAARSLLNGADLLRHGAQAADLALRDAEADAGRRLRLKSPGGVDVHDGPGEATAAVGGPAGVAGGLVTGASGVRESRADVFANLGRRNQGLVTRQVRLLEELERTEVDPERRAALARLDHLAGCMRRNAESLLVLAGLDPPPRSSGPVDVGDIARAAADETEPVDRVRFGTFPPLAVTGVAVAAVTHLLAELIDNALRFSSPQTVVTVAGRQAGGGLVIGISDEGVGMAADALEHANALLAGGGDGAAPGAQLGLVVVSRLAVRHGLGVELDSVSGEGLTARVTIPAQLVEPGAGHRRSPEPASSSGPAASRSGRAGSPSRPAPSTSSDPAAALTGSAARPEPVEAADVEATTPSGFRRRVPQGRRPAPPRSRDSGRAGGPTRQLRPLAPESATARKARLDRFVAGRSTASELLGLEGEPAREASAPAGDGHDVEAHNGSADNGSADNGTADNGTAGGYDRSRR